MDGRTEPLNGMLAYVLCPERACGYSEGFGDLRRAPAACPQCGRGLVATCPQCGMLWRNRWGLCTNCGAVPGRGARARAAPVNRPA